MKKVLRFLTLAAMLCIPWVTQAQTTLTVADGTATNGLVPIYDYYADVDQHNQIIYPASLLSDMAGGTITNLSFYASGSGEDGMDLTVTIRLGEVDVTTLSSLLSPTLTTVWTGSIDNVADLANLSLSSSYVYQGENLLIDIQTVSAGEYAEENTLFLGVTQASANAYSSAGYWGDPTTVSFLPKTTFTYTPGAPVTCLKPTALAAGSVTATGATLSWTAGNAETAWTVEYGTASDFAGAASQNVATTPTLNLTGLTANTTYYVRVKAVCGVGDESSWTSSSFYTGYCTPAPTSVDGSGITNVTFGTGGNIVNNSTRPTTSPYYGDYSAQIGAAAASTVASVDITFATGYTYGTLIWVDWNNDLTFGDNEIVYMGTSASTNPTTLSASFTVPADQPTGDYRMRIGAADSYFDSYISNPSGSGAHDPCGAGTYKVFHDYTLRVTEAPSCMNPTALAASAVTATSATLGWTAGGTETAWTVEYGTAADFAGATTQNVTTTTLNLTGLTAQTTYYARVKAVCGIGNESAWSTISFTTACGAYSIPYTYGFEDAASFACWDVIAGTAIANSSSNAHESSYYLKFSGTTSNMVALPIVNAPTNTLRLEFWTRPESTGGSSGNFAVGYMTDVSDASSFVAIATYNSTEMTTSYVKKTVDFASAPAGARIALRQYNCATYYYWYVDDVTVKEMPNCAAPTALAAANVTTSQAELSWTAISGETEWTLYYKAASDADYTEVTGVTANPYTLTGLTPATTYSFYVKANCSGSDVSEASEVFQFTTACAAVSVFPYTQNFDALTAGNNVLPVCWNYINTTTYSSYQGYPKAYNSGAHSGSNCLYFYSYYSSWSDYDPQPQYAILPEMTGLSGKQVTLWAKGYNASSTFKIGTMSDPTDASTFEPFEITSGVYEQALTSSYQEFEYIIPATTDAYLAIMIDAASSSRTTNGVYIDDISIAEPPTCRKPSSLMLNTPSDRTAHTATLKWTNGAGGQTAWQIAYSTSSTFAPAADFTPNGTTEWLVDAGTNPYTLTGLTANTDYYAYVRANCGSGDYSAWCSTKATFTTTSGTQAPTGLAATPESPYAATVTWTGVAANDNHASYDLFYSQNSTPSPNNETVPSFTGITAESYLIPGLHESTTYYVWVRDNCGADGYSDWSSRATFTTPEFCPAPTGVTVSSATAHGATISWTGTSDSYNVYVGKVTVHATSYDFEDNAISANFTNDATNPWTVTTDDKHAGTYAVKSAGGFTSTQSDLTLTVNLTEAATITFWDKASSENTDYGRFLIDGLQKHQTSGTSGSWTERTYPLTAGSHTLVWRYYKDYSVNSGDDCYYVDDISITSIEVASWERYEAPASSYVLFDDGNIDPETDYAVKVVGVCESTESHYESAVVYFTTSADCDASNVAVDNISFHSADITWDGNSADGYTVMRGHDEIAHEFVNENFAGGVPTSAEWTNDPTRPWTAVDGHIQSGNGGVASTTSQISVTVDMDAAGYIEFDAECRGEGTTWDVCTFTIDVNQKFSYGNQRTNDGFVHYKFPVAAGTHTFTWKYSKDSSTDPAGDYFAIDNVQIYTTSIDWEEVETVDVLHYSFDGLDDGTHYYVKVSPECDRAIESDVAEFTTLALPTISVVANKWYALSSPMHDAGQTYESISHISSNIITGTYDFLRYDEPSSTWQSQKSGAGHTGFTRLEQGRGYIYRRADDAVLKIDGEPNTGNVNVAITKDVDGWNLIGNPYLTTIRLNSTYIAPASTAELVSGGYYKLNTNGTWTVIYSSSDIVAGQAVLVKASTAGTLVLRPTASKSVSAAEEESNKGIVFSVSNDKFTDVAYAMFADGEGLPKISHLNPEAPMLSIGGYAIATLDENTERFPMSVSGQGRYTLALKENSTATGYLHLIDRATGRDIDLLATPEYSFVGTGMADRFEVRLMPGMDENGNVNFVRIDGSRLVVDGEGELQVYDVMGRQLGSAQVNGTTTLDRSSLGIVSAGVYVVRLDGNTQKIVVK